MEGAPDKSIAKIPHPPLRNTLPLTPRTRRQRQVDADRRLAVDMEMELQGTGQAVRTFDAATGEVRLSAFGIPKRSYLVAHQYRKMLTNDMKMQEIASYVARMPLKRQRALAIESALQKHQDEFGRMVSRDVYAPEVSFQRAEIMYRMAIHNMVGHLSADTRELSMIRIHSAAVDTVVYQEAEKVADQQIKQHLAKVVPDSTSGIDILSMTLDAWRRINVPEPPRRVIEPAPVTISRRRASVRLNGSFVGIPSNAAMRPTFAPSVGGSTGSMEKTKDKDKEAPAPRTARRRSASRAMSTGASENSSL